jgi:hypothetical protein
VGKNEIRIFLSCGHPPLIKWENYHPVLRTPLLEKKEGIKE